MSSEKEIVTLLRQLLEEQRKLTQRVERLEQNLSSNKETHEGGSLTPTLVKVLKSIQALGGESDPHELEKKLGVSRPMVSAYLNRLSEMGYIEKLSNPYANRPVRYVFRLDLNGLPTEIRKLVEREKPS